MSHIHLRLRHLRQKRNLSQEDLARKLGISRQSIIALEQGNSLPSLPVIVAILRELDIPFQELFENVWMPFRTQPSPSPKNRLQEVMLHRMSYSSRTIPVQLIESESHLYIEAMLAGVKEDDVTIDLGSQHIMILGIRRSRIPIHEGLTRIEENEYGPLMRIISLPFPIDTAIAEAEFRNGMLLIALPKLLPQLKRRITFRKEEHGSR